MYSGNKAVFLYDQYRINNIIIQDPTIFTSYKIPITVNNSETPKLNQSKPIDKNILISNKQKVNNLLTLLFNNQIINQVEIDNINKNLDNGQIDHQTIITYLENKKSGGVYQLINNLK